MTKQRGKNERLFYGKVYELTVTNLKLLLRGRTTRKLMDVPLTITCFSLENKLHIAVKKTEKNNMYDILPILCKDVCLNSHDAFVHQCLPP